MTECVCPEDGRMVDSSDRVYIMEPGAETVVGGVHTKDPSKVHIFDKNCPVHGYAVIDEGDEQLED